MRFSLYHCALCHACTRSSPAQCWNYKAFWCHVSLTDSAPCRTGRCPHRPPPRRRDGMRYRPLDRYSSTTKGSPPLGLVGRRSFIRKGSARPGGSPTGTAPARARLRRKARFIGRALNRHPTAACAPPAVPQLCPKIWIIFNNCELITISLARSPIHEGVEVRPHAALPVALAVADQQLTARPYVLGAVADVHTLAELTSLAAPQLELDVGVLARVPVIVDLCRGEERTRRGRTADGLARL